LQSHTQLQALEINELEDSEPLELTNEEVAYFQQQVNAGIENSKLDIIPVTGGRFKIRANGWIGAVSLPSGRALYIEPKVKANFYKLLAYVLDLREWKYFERVILAKGGSILAEVVAAIFLQRAEDVTTQGLFKTYRTLQGELGVVRGRILVEQQIRRWKLNSIMVEYDELTFDCIENRAVLFAAHALRGIVRDPELQRGLGDISTALLSQEVQLRRIHGYEIEQVQVSRLNDYYEPLLRLCKFIVESAWIERLSVEGEIPVFGFLINANELFEDFLTKLVEESMPEYQVIPQKRIHDLLVKATSSPGLQLTQDKIREITLKPDIMVQSKTGPILAVDAKYKLEVSNNDIYQAVSYSLALHMPTVLVLPQDTGGIMGAYTIVAHDVKIFIMTVNLGVETTRFESALKNEIREKLAKIVQH